jgi:NADH:ubiquinone oxidoreductase subunit 2 (subunit N)
MYTGEGEEGSGRVPIPFTAGVAVSITVIFTIVVGLVPDPFSDLARHATLLF